MGHHRHHSRRRRDSSSSSSSSESSFGGNVPGFWMPLNKAQTKPEKRRKHSPENINIINNLAVPKAARGRSTSVGGQPNPQVVFIEDRSRSRRRSRSSSRSRRGKKSHSHSRSRSRSHSRHEPAERGRQMTFEQWQKVQEADAARIANKERDARDRAEEKYNERKKTDELKWKLEQKEAAQKAAEEKKEMERMKAQWEHDKEEAEAKEKARRDQIILEAKVAEEKKKKDAEELRKKILAEEEEKQKKKKEEEKREKEEFEHKFRDQLLARGYTAKQIEDLLSNKREESKKNNEMAIAVNRPTYIKVHRQHLHPDTLEYYNLPWHYDPRDSDYIIIKQYIDKDFQEVLFEHSRTILKRKLITDSYTKTTTVELKPSNVYKKEDKMYIVRQKSKSPSRARRGSWMFT